MVEERMKPMERLAAYAKGDPVDRLEKWLLRWRG
jgi:hypothetical protein